MNKIIQDDIRTSFLNVIYKRIQQGKSSLVIGGIGSGKTKFLDMIQPKRKTVPYVQSLGSLNYILVSILRKSKFLFTPKMNRSAEYLDAICNIKDLVIIIDDTNDLRTIVFRYIKRIMDAEIPVIMTGNPEAQMIMRESHEDIFCRLKVLNLPPVSVVDFRKYLLQFDPDTLYFPPLSRQKKGKVKLFFNNANSKFLNFFFI
jgi:hypothetical protein